MAGASQGVVPSATFSDSTNGAYTLPPQTTPFVPTASPAPVCNRRSVLCFTTAGQLVPGYACDLVDQISAGGYQYYDTDCYPPHYDLINNGEPNLDRTVAYPGTACPAGFTPACTTTLTLTNPTAKPTPYTGTLTQTWCCPQPVGGALNDWVCTDKDEFNPTSRLCVSQIANTAGSDLIWFTAGTGTVTATTTGYTTSAIDAEMSIRVMRAAVPLGTAQQAVLNGLAGLAPVSETTSSTGGIPASSTNSSSNNGGGGSNAGIIAGIVVGCLALLGFIGVGIFLCLRYKRDRKREEEERRRRAELEAENGSQNQGYLNGTEKEVSKEDVNALGSAERGPPSELPVHWTTPPPPPLPTDGKYMEMGADTGAVELPTGYNYGTHRGSAFVDGSPTLPASAVGREGRRGGEADGDGGGDRDRDGSWV